MLSEMDGAVPHHRAVQAMPHHATATLAAHSQQSQQEGTDFSFNRAGRKAEED